MANTTIKITQLQNIGNGLASNTLLPVVNTTGTAITQKVTVGNVANFIMGQAGNTLSPAFLSTLAYSVVNAAQPNITSVGTLNVNTLKISGGVNGYILQTDGASNLAWVAQSGSGNGNPGGSNSQLQFNNGGIFAGDPDLTWDAGNNKLTTANLAASTVTISGNTNTVNLNATGNVRPNAIYTDRYYYANGYVFGGGGGNGAPGGTDTQIQFNDNGVFGGNAGFTFDKVTGILSSPFLTGNGSGLSNIQGANVSGAVAIATYATNIAGANVTGAVTYAGTANSVAVANVVGIGNIATLALDGSTSNVLHGNGVFAPIAASAGIANGTSNVTVPVSNGNVNIVSAGNTTMVVTGTGANITGTLNATGNITGAYVLGNGSQLTNLPVPTVIQDIATVGDMSIMTYDGNLKYVSYATVEPSTGNLKAGNISTTGNITGGNIIGSGSGLSNVAVKTSGSWTLASGVNTVSISVPVNGTYSIWINGNIPNGIVTYTATAVVTNTNVPVLGSQYAWYYETGNALVFTSIPDQFVGTVGSISNASPYLGNTANVLTFGITNNSGSSQVINWGYTKL